MVHLKAAVIQGVSKVLGIEYHLHCSWRPQSSEKVEKANDIIKRHLRKLTQETQDNWFKVKHGQRRALRGMGKRDAHNGA